MRPMFAPYVDGAAGRYGDFSLYDIEGSTRLLQRLGHAQQARRET
jgi:hypothetical protein